MELINAYVEASDGGEGEENAVWHHDYNQYDQIVYDYQALGRKIVELLSEHSSLQQRKRRSLPQSVQVRLGRRTEWKSSSFVERLACEVDVNLFVALIELENEGVTEMVVETLANLFGVSERARIELSDVVFGYIENIVFHTGLTVKFLKMLSECSFESFPLETIGETVESMLLECFASKDAWIVVCALDIFRECFAVHTEWVDHGKLVDAVLSLASTGTYDIKKSACGALIEMCNSCPLDRILDLMKFHVVQGLSDIVDSEDTQSALAILECLGDLGAKTKTLLSDWAESDLVHLVKETLERLIDTDDKTIAAKALYELHLLKD